MPTARGALCLPEQKSAPGGEYLGAFARIIESASEAEGRNQQEARSCREYGGTRCQQESAHWHGP